MATTQTVAVRAETKTAPPRILIVEDERITAISLRNQLRQLGYEVPGAAHSGAGAIEKAGELHPDLVLMDISLEGELDGVEAAAAIRDAFRIPVVFLTAYSYKEMLERVKVAEPYGYVLKPF